jgi:hypothetical protein
VANLSFGMYTATAGAYAEQQPTAAELPPRTRWRLRPRHARLQADGPHQVLNRGQHPPGSAYRRLTARLRRKKAAVALGHAILVIVYHLLSQADEVYQDLGVQYFDENDAARPIGPVGATT